jgi:hypothetical protein
LSLEDFINMYIQFFSRVEMKNPRFVGCSWFIGLIGLGSEFPEIKGKQAHPVLKYRVPHGSQFWVRFPNERNQGKQAHPVLKYRVPHGSHIIGPAVINTHTIKDLNFPSMYAFS